MGGDFHFYWPEDANIYTQDKNKNMTTHFSVHVMQAGTMWEEHIKSTLPGVKLSQKWLINMQKSLHESKVHGKPQN